MNFKKNESILTFEYKKHLCINAFQRDSFVYCAKCSKRKNWKIVDEISGSFKNGISIYSFFCHGEKVEVDAKNFCKNNRIFGPKNKSYITFQSEVPANQKGWYIQTEPPEIQRG